MDITRFVKFVYWNGRDLKRKYISIFNPSDNRGEKQQKKKKRNTANPGSKFSQILQYGNLKGAIWK